MSAEYDIINAFYQIENELIESATRNFKRHRAEETELGYNWTQWQTEQLTALEDYRMRNAEKYGKRFSDLNDKIDALIEQAAADGESAEEIKTLEAIKKGYKPPRTPTEGAEGAFFEVSDGKLDALIKSVRNDFERVEYAVLRKANDDYRQAIFNAQVYANTGAGTYEKAVDMARRDMLRRGLDCVVYKNGARHTLSDYCDMAIRTANKRAYLQGAGDKRQEWGISTVIVNRRQGACPKCAVYVGKVFIDDVWSGGKADGKHPLLSTAIEAGLYHPRCKDSHSTYYEGITTVKPYNQAEIQQLEQDEAVEEKQKYYELQAEKNQRIADNSLDAENKRIYQARADEAEKKAVEVSMPPNNEIYTKAEKAAVEEYVSGEGVWINQYLRGLYKTNISPDDIEYLNDLISATEKQTVTQTKLYRAVDASTIFGKMSAIEFEDFREAVLFPEIASKPALSTYKKFEKKLNIPVQEKGFMSTTTEKDVAIDWNGFTGSDKDIVLELDVGEGIKGVDVSKYFEVEGFEQSEILLEKDLIIVPESITTISSDEFGTSVAVKAKLLKNKKVKK